MKEQEVLLHFLVMGILQKVSFFCHFYPKDNEQVLGLDTMYVYFFDLHMLTLR